MEKLFLKKSCELIWIKNERVGGVRLLRRRKATAQMTVGDRACEKWQSGKVQEWEGGGIRDWRRRLMGMRKKSDGHQNEF